MLFFEFISVLLATRYGFSDAKIELHCNDNKPALSLRGLKTLLGLEMLNILKMLVIFIFSFELHLFRSQALLVRGRWGNRCMC